MNGFIKYFLILSLSICVFTSCTSSNVNDNEDLVAADDGDLSLDSEAAPPDDAASVADVEAAQSAATDDFAEFDAASGGDTAAATDAEGQLSLDENAQAQALTPPESEVPAPPTADADTPAIIDPMATVPEINKETEAQAAAEAQAEAQPPVVEPAPVPVVESTPIETEKPATILGLKYKKNDTGGTVLVEANRPITFSTRMNKDLNQLVIEVPNASLPAQLRRPLDTRDFEGSIGKVSAYAENGNARFVVQLRNGAQEPFVAQEGNALIITANDVSGTSTALPPATMTGMESPGSVPSQNSEMTTPVAPSENAQAANGEQMLPNRTLEEFLSSTQDFYGRRISIETNDMEVRDALRFLSEESGINMVVAESVGGRIGLKLRQVPWDQALVVIMRAKNLGYIRQGNILRIAPLKELEAEEQSLAQLQLSRRKLEPTSIRVFRLSYANSSSLATTITSLMNTTPAANATASATDRPQVRVVADSTSNSLIVTATKEDLDRVSRIVGNFDTPPPQVLIEGKIVEASEQFNRSVGISWSSAGGSVVLGKSNAGPIYAYPSIASGSGGGRSATSAYMNFNLSIGTLDILGDLAASLALFELDNKVKVLSSPKLVTIAGKSAKIESSTQIPQVSRQTVTGVGTTATVTGVDAKISLDVTPLVTADNSINMKINVQRDIPQAPQLDGTVLKDSRSANTEVLVKNGQTAVLGGIYQNDETEGVTGVPGLKDIPVLGYLFKSKSVSRSKNELLIFVTPRIISGGDASTANPVSKDL